MPPVLKKANAKGKKKHRSLTALSSSGEDDAESDEDFKGSRYVLFPLFLVMLFLE